MVSKWARQYKLHGKAAFKRNNKGNGQRYTDKDYRKLEDENERLKKILGERDLEVAILRDLLNPHWQIK